MGRAHQLATFLFLTLFCLAVTASPLKWIVAKFNTSELVGKITASQGHDKTSSTWTAHWTDFDKKLCPSGTPDSQYADGLCYVVRGGTQTCDLHTDFSTCEVGDMSGKVGRMSLNSSVQTWHDPFSCNVEKYRGRAVVLHCCSLEGCSPRIACAKII
eukprot:jgi/Tetstr1/435060/TSEL_024030.t1